MQIRNNIPLDLAGDDGETITVRATAKNPGDTVAYARDGEKGVLPQPYIFTLRKAQADPSILTLIFSFFGANGGFDVNVSGSHGGPPSVYSYPQLGVSVGTISYSFDVL